MSSKYLLLNMRVLTHILSSKFFNEIFEMDKNDDE